MLHQNQYREKLHLLCWTGLVRSPYIIIAKDLFEFALKVREGPYIEELVKIMYYSNIR